MNRLEMPANLQLMDTNSPRINALPRITSLDTFDGKDQTNFHPQGLYSTTIYGRVGTPDRDRRFGVIHTKVTVIHPFIFQKLVKLKALYKDIIFGKAYAEWNPEICDFESSDIINGNTGFNFFVSYLDKIKFKLTDSVTREANVKLVEKAIREKTALIINVPVLPAGLRDAYVEADGRVTEDEINPMYRSILSATNSLPDSVDLNNDVFNTTRLSIQNGVNNVFEYLWNMYKGKNGFAQQQFYSRKVFNATRNVLSAMNTATPELGVKHSPGLADTCVGLYQTMKGVLPKAQYMILNGWLATVFSSGDGNAYLTNTKTMKMEMVRLDRNTYDRFTTPDGVEKIINAFFNRRIRNRPVMIGGYYVGLVYRGEVHGKKAFKFFSDINDLPEGLDVKDVGPITWGELLYVAGYRDWNNFPCVFTRYPVAGLGSTFTSYAYVKTTIVGEQRWELDENWQIKEFNDGNPIQYAYEYPKQDMYNYYETVSIHPGRIGGAAADFDGDTGSVLFLYTTESMSEIKKHMNSRQAYLNPKGGFINSPMIDTVKRSLTGLMRR